MVEQPMLAKEDWQPGEQIQWRSIFPPHRRAHRPIAFVQARTRASCTPRARKGKNKSGMLLASLEQRRAKQYRSSSDFGNGYWPGSCCWPLRESRRCVARPHKLKFCPTASRCYCTSCSRDIPPSTFGGQKTRLCSQAVPILSARQHTATTRSHPTSTWPSTQKQAGYRYTTTLSVSSCACSRQMSRSRMALILVSRCLGRRRPCTPSLSHGKDNLATEQTRRVRVLVPTDSIRAHLTDWSLHTQMQPSSPHVNRSIRLSLAQAST